MKNHTIETTTDHRCPTCSTRSTLAAALSELEHMMHRAMTNVCVNSLLYETALREPNVLTSKKAAAAIMESLVVLYTVKKATEDMAGTNVESDSDCTKHKPQPLPKL